MVIITAVSFAVEYSGYKKGQEFGLASAIIASDMGSYSWIDENGTYADQCEDAYNRLNSRTSDITIDGMTYDASDVRKAEEEMRTAFADVMESAGYDRYSSYNIADWFKYTNSVEYFAGHYWYRALPIFCYIVLIFSIVFTIIVNREAKKELVVYEDSVLCRFNPKNSKQLVFKDINNIDFGKNSLKLIGTGCKFKIANITNAENIKSVIIDKKKSEQVKPNSAGVSNADELKKYKDLLDSGVISQEEFNAKKKQLLGL